MPRTSWQDCVGGSSVALSSGLPWSPSTVTWVGVTEQVGNAGMALFRPATRPASVKSFQHGHCRNGTVVELVDVEVELLVLVDVEVELLVLLDVEVVLEVLVDVLVEVEVDVEVDVELEVEVDDDEDVEVVVVRSHQSTCGSISVASWRQSAAAAESSMMLRSIMPRMSWQDCVGGSSVATSSGSSCSPSIVTCVCVASQKAKAGMALFSSLTSWPSVKSFQQGHDRNGIVVELVDDEVELLVLVDVELLVELLVLVEDDVELEVELLLDVDVLVELEVELLVLVEDDVELEVELLVDVDVLVELDVELLVLVEDDVELDVELLVDVEVLVELEVELLVLVEDDVELDVEVLVLVDDDVELEVEVEELVELEVELLVLVDDDVELEVELLVDVDVLVELDVELLVLVDDDVDELVDDDVELEVDVLVDVVLLVLLDVLVVLEVLDEVLVVDDVELVVEVLDGGGMLPRVMRSRKISLATKRPSSEVPDSAPKRPSGAQTTPMKVELRSTWKLVPPTKYWMSWLCTPEPVSGPMNESGRKTTDCAT